MTVYFAALLAIPKEHILLVRENAFESIEEQWSIPSGRVKEGESFSDAALRELREETGLIGRRANLQKVALTRLYDSRQITTETVTYRYIGDLGQGSPEPEDDEIIEAAWVSVDRASAILECTKYRPLVDPTIDVLMGRRNFSVTLYEYQDPSQPPRVSEM